MPISVVQANPMASVNVTTNPYAPTPIQPRGPAATVPLTMPTLQGSTPQLQPTATAQTLQPAAPVQKIQPAATVSKIQPAATVQKIQPAASAQSIQPAVGGQPVGRVIRFMDGSGLDENGNFVPAPTPTPTAPTPAPVTPGVVGMGISPLPNTYAQPTSVPPSSGQSSSYTTAPQQPQPAPQVDTTRLSDLEKQIQSYYELSPEELAAQQALNNQNEAYLQGSENVRNKVIPMQFITGQLESLDRMNALQQIPLQQRLALAQAKRQSALDASKFALSREDAKVQAAREASKPISIAPGSTLLDPTTGRVIYQSDPTPSYQANPLTGELFNTKTGQSQGGFTSNSTGGAISIPGNTLAARNNNPGNLRFVGQAGATQGEGGFARFATPEAGYQALLSQIQLDAGRGATLSSFINKYAPPSENNTSLYIQQAVQALGVNPNTPISQIDINALGAFMAKKESGTSIGQSNLGTDVIGQLAQQVKQNPNLLQSLPDTQQKAVIARLAQTGQSVPQAQTTEAKNKQQSISVLQNTVNSLEQLGNQIGWKGVGGAFQGSIGQFLAKNFGTGSQQEQMLRSYIGQVQGTIAKERGGTSFTPNEQALLETYTPTINDSPLVIQSKLAVLKDFINNTVNSYGGQGGQQNNDPLNLGI